MDGTWLLEQLTASPMRAGLWLALSFLLAGIATGVTRTIAPDLERLVRVVRWVQVPYIGLILGGLSPRLMGLSEFDWSSGFSVGVVALAGLLVLLFLVRIWLQMSAEVPNPNASIGRFSSLSLIESSAQEFHWCFLRGAVWELLISLASPLVSPQYWAVWIGAAIALPGIYISSRSLSDRLMTTLVLVTTSSVFLFTRSFWLCCFLHLGLRVILHWRHQPTRQSAT
jgi:hypothetical protein